MPGQSIDPAVWLNSGALGVLALALWLAFKLFASASADMRATFETIYTHQQQHNARREEVLSTVIELNTKNWAENTKLLGELRGTIGRMPKDVPPSV